MFGALFKDVVTRNWNRRLAFHPRKPACMFGAMRAQLRSGDTWVKHTKVSQHTGFHVLLPFWSTLELWQNETLNKTRFCLGNSEWREIKEVLCLIFKGIFIMLKNLTKMPQRCASIEIWPVLSLLLTSPSYTLAQTEVGSQQHGGAELHFASASRSVWGTDFLFQWVVVPEQDLPRSDSSSPHPLYFRVHFSIPSSSIAGVQKAC